MTKEQFDSLMRYIDSLINFYLDSDMHHYDNHIIKQQESLKKLLVGESLPIPWSCASMVPSGCRWYSDQKDCNGDVAISFCSHPENPSETEGNNIESKCPLIAANYKR